MHARTPWCGLVCACLAAAALTAPSARADDPVVRLDALLQRTDQRIPSSTQFVLEIRSIGKEALRGELEIWPADGSCDALPTDDRQHYQLAMVASGNDPDRVLRATVPPLQVNTRFCIRVRVIHGLDEVRAVGFAARVTERLFTANPTALPAAWIDVDQACTAADRRTQLVDHIELALGEISNEDLASTRAALTLPAAVLQGVAGAIQARIDAERKRLGDHGERTVALATDDNVRKTRTAAIGKAVVDGMDVEGLCATLTDARRAAASAGDLLARADADQKNAWAALPGLVASHRFSARLPALVTGTAPNLEVRRFDDIADDDTSLTAAALELENFAPELAEMLRDLRAAKPEEKKALRAAYQAKLKALAPRPAALVYFAGGGRAVATLDVLFPPPGTTPDTLAAEAKARGIVLANVDLLKRELLALRRDDANASVWAEAADTYQRAAQAYQGAVADKRTKEDAVDTARKAIAAKVKERLAAADVRALVIDVTSIASEQTMRAPQTDEGVTSVAPDIGVLLAFPMHRDNALTGWEPWLVPYAGVNIYRQRVDRVVPFDQLVGSTWKQRLSVTFGALLTRPKLNAVAISMPFRDSGIIPTIAVGWRLTSFTRASIGGFAFDYQDANPASVAKHHGFALWIGASIDADVWTTVAGKAFK